MRKNSTMKAEYDGPTINGRPALSVENVQRWIKDAYGDHVFPSQGEAVPIVQALNHCAWLEHQWKGTPEFKQMRRSNPSKKRMQRIHLALTTLQHDLPDLIEDHVKIDPDARTTRLVGVIALLDCANSLAPIFQTYGRSPGREPELWRRIAKNIAPMIVAAVKSAGVRRAGFGKPTSPAVKIMGAALEYLEVSKSPEAIVEAVRDRKKRVGK
jgi:hypothetical protein